MTRGIGIDVGGTTTRVALFERIENDHLREVDRWEGSTTRDDVARAVTAGIRHVAARPDVDEIVACGIGMPEYVYDGTLRSHMVVRLTESGATEITGALAATGASPMIRLESDVRCAAIAEWSMLGNPTSSIVYVSVGTGLSSTLVLPGGRCWEGHTGSALSLGEWPSPEIHRNLEQFASGEGIAERFAAVTGEHLTAREITVRSATGDTHAEYCLAEAGQAIGDAVRRLNAVLDPGQFIVGGGLGTAQSPLWDSLVVAAAVPISGRTSVRIHRAQLGSRSGERGAAMLALQAFGAGLDKTGN